MSEWISVKDELPTPRMVQIAFDNGGTWFGMYLRGKWRHENEKHSFIDEEDYSVTHWAELLNHPDKPKL